MADAGTRRHAFTVAERDRARTRLIAMAREDARVVAAAEVGSQALAPGDRWSDIDLTFGLAADATVPEVLADWTRAIEHELEGVPLFDLPFRSTLYRVFLLPGALQVDVSFTPGAEFGALGPKFRLLFGTAVERERGGPPAAESLLGLGAHHAVRARIAIERDRPWQAEYWIRSLRDESLALECLRHGLETRYARGYDALPAEVTALHRDTLVRSLDRAELMRALQRGIEELLRAAEDAGAMREKLGASLLALTAPDWTGGPA